MRRRRRRLQLGLAALLELHHREVEAAKVLIRDRLLMKNATIRKALKDLDAYVEHVDAFVTTIVVR